MFNSGQSGLLFGGTATQGNTFGQNQNSPTSAFFGSTVGTNGTTYPFQAVDGNDTVSKNGANVNVSTKIQFITAMKAYELKSIDELRCEDYQANRLTSNKGTAPMFAGQQATGMMNTQPTMFSSAYSPFTASQTNQSTLFTSTNQQTNSFGNKSIFSATNTGANTNMGAFNNQSKPTSLFGANSTSTANKNLFGGAQPTQSTGLFGSSTTSATPTLFGTPQPTQTTPFFGAQTQAQQNQSTNLFGNATNSFGFQPQSTSTLFGGAAKPFNAPTGFGATSSTASVFGNTAPSVGGSIFGQTNSPASSFGSTQKAPTLFSGTSAFSNQAVSSSGVFGQPATAAPLGQQSLFGAQQNVQPQNTFGNNSFFSASTSKPSLFGNATSTPFPAQPGSGLFGSSVQPFNATQTVVSGAVVQAIGYNSPAEALLQQHISQQKILSLVSNNPYGINKLFMGQSMLSSNKVATSYDTITNNSNLMSLAIKKNDTDKFGMQRRQVLNQKVKIVPNNLHKVFSGFDEDEDSSMKSGNIERHFFTKREDWKYLPPNAFEKSQRSINTSETLHSRNNLSGSRIINDNNVYGEVTSSPLDNGDSFLRAQGVKLHSTPIIVNGSSFKNANLSPICYGNKQFETKSKKEVEDVNLGVSSFHNLDSIADESVLLDDHIESHPKFSKDEVAKKENKVYSCGIKLTRSGYYTAPMSDVLDKLVLVNEDGDLECCVENFIIGREGYGSIRFPGFTDVYNLNLDELVDIKRKEVSVYPDENMKPDEGDELNKLAQVVLQEVWPVDKTTGDIISDEDRLKTMRFEDKLIKATEKMGARFIGYTAKKGVWIFEVDHFSKYRYDESDDEEEAPLPTTTTPNNVLKVTESNRGPNNDTSSLAVVSAEADSMTNFLDDDFSSTKRGLNRFFDRNNNKSVQRMRESLFQNDSDEDEHGTSALLTTKKAPMGINFSYKEEPEAKRFETFEMGKSIMNATLNSSITDNQKQLVLHDDVEMLEVTHGNNRPIKPLVAEPVSSTSVVKSDYKCSQVLKVSAQCRDTRSIKMPYLPLTISKYSDIEIKDVHKRYLFDAAVSKANQFRVGFNMSSIKESPGLRIYVKDNGNCPERSLVHIQHKNTVPNAIKVMKLDFEFSSYQEKLLLSALERSNCSFDDGEDCPLWRSNEDLGVLGGYVSVQNQFKDDTAEEVSVLGRSILLCHALYAKIGSDDDRSPIHLKNIERKQALSKWIRMESRDDLMRKVERVLQTSTKIDVEKCNDLILESLCCGEIKLACRLASLSKQHRMALLISQSSGSIRDKAFLREQLDSWITNKTDRNIPSNIMCIYVLLSGQTNLVTSDGSLVTPLRDLKWYQALGCYNSHIQPYLDSIKSALDLYTDDFKTDFSVPPPFPFAAPQRDSVECDTDYPYFDCCYHLLRLHGDSLHDLDAVLNPPAMSTSPHHQLCSDWSASWHLSNILLSLGHRHRASNDRLCSEWAAQLERGGRWPWAVFVVLHISDRAARKSMLNDTLMRNVRLVSRSMSAEESFVIDRLRVPSRCVHRAKAIYCKNVIGGGGGALRELEAYHWLMAGEYERSRTIYVEEILPRWLLDDRVDRVAEVVAQLLPGRCLDDNVHIGAYGLYVEIMGRVRSLRLTNDADTEETLEATEVLVARLAALLAHFDPGNDAVRRVCKGHMQTLCTEFLASSTAMS